jgi:hypothetical protein
MYNNSHEGKVGNRTYCNANKGLVYESVSHSLYQHQVGNGTGLGLDPKKGISK